jgi:hypothetical protein
MFMFMRCALLCLVCLGLSGCAIGLTSESTADAEGTVYYLPKSLVEITVVKAGKPESYTISAQGKSVPDLDHRYVLSYQPNVLYDDRFCIGRDADGLLTTVQFAAEDKTQQKRIACPPDEICFRTMKTVPVGIRLGPSPVR